MTPAEFRTLRLKLGLTQPELGKRLGVHWTTIARWESGKRKMPQMAKLAILKIECTLVNPTEEGFDHDC